MKISAKNSNRNSSDTNRKTYNLSFIIYNSRSASWQNGGFTLIETLISLLIFSLSVAAMIFVISHGSADATYSKNKLIASYLGQEGIELVRYLRDSTVLSETAQGGGWVEFSTEILDNCSASPCNIDPEIITDQSVSHFSGNGLNFSRQDGYSSVVSATQSPFSRYISAKKIDDDRVKITSKVEWKQGTSTFSVTSREILFNWPLK